MKSLRTQLATTVGAATMLFASISALAIVQQSWQRSKASLADDMALQAQVEEGDAELSFDATGALSLGTRTGQRFALGFAGDGQSLAAVGSISASEIAAVSEALGITTLTSDATASATIDLDDGRTWTAVAVPCDRLSVCAFFAIGRTQSSFGSYLVARLGWMALIALALTGLAVVAARWVVGRSLRPVDRMRRELDEIAATDVHRRVGVPSSGDELEALGDSFNHTLTRLASSVDAQRRFASDAAHELRSPLTGVRATLEVARGKPAMVNTAIDSSLVELDRAAALLEDLLVLARREGSPEPLPMRLVDLDDMVNAEVRNLLVRRTDRQVDRTAVRPVQALAHGESIARVVRNLLDNAATHASSRVLVALREEPGPVWTLTVEDDGPGIAEADRGRVFERFTRLDEARARHQGGTGLGLAIVRELVTAHGGSVRVTQSPLGGAAFVLIVPLHR
jgi:signal transduction histidine kinase